MTAAGAAAAAVLAAGCGGSGGSGGPAAAGSPAAATAAASDNGVAALPAAEILQRAVQALRDARSVRETGTVGGNGMTITVDLRLDGAGSCAGTLRQAGVGGFQVVKAGQELWVKPDHAFWENNGDPALAELVGDRYLKTTSDNPQFAEVVDLCDLGALANRLGSGGSDLAKGAATTVQGHRTIPVTGHSDTGSGTLYVAADGPAVPLRMERDTGGRVDLGDFGTPVPSATPGPDQSVDLDQLQPGASPSAPASV
ncbi:hypothetical protein KCH_14080 [Kitasatospora cheerisanensis KCTC 2395]|uniref:Lipoprotein n=2 Tax=Kitasatospora cheerisanensis TaxID=81942 RepID=A0A066YZ17_9ACTN|nr:hypothetical protein KCH_14080 [Kitasatospora cheerisanensis KCTC 2395]